MSAAVTPATDAVLFMKYPAARILVFARAPVSGSVKTRLADGLGFDRATRLYVAMLEHTVAMAAQAELAGVSLYATPDVRHPRFLALQQRFQLCLETQNGKDLGERMLQALEAELQLAEYALLIGTDCPGLDASYLDSALARLQQGDDVVIGPAEDGGYVLIGVRRPEANLFRAIPWSTDRLR